MDYYNKNAKELFTRYQSLDPEKVHRWLEFLPEQPGLACDIGAGSGRDAAWLASKGWDVIAIEPSKDLRALGEHFTSSMESHLGSVIWLGDALPDLNKLRSLDQRFQLIVISAVWMHLPPPQRERAMRIVSELLAPGGVMVITLRHGPDEAARFHPVTPDEVIGQAKNRALITKAHFHGPDSQQREGIDWDCLVFHLLDSNARN